MDAFDVTVYSLLLSNSDTLAEHTKCPAEPAGPAYRVPQVVSYTDQHGLCLPSAVLASVETNISHSCPC